MKYTFLITALFLCISSCGRTPANEPFDANKGKEVFLDSLKSEFPGYEVKRAKEAFDFTGMLFHFCSKESKSKKYTIDDYSNIFLTKGGKYTSAFYYELVEFNTSPDLDGLLDIIQNNNCLDERSSRVMLFKRLNQRTVLLCNYYGIDGEQLKAVIDRVFAGEPIVECSPDIMQGKKAPVRIN